MFFRAEPDNFVAAPAPGMFFSSGSDSKWPKKHSAPALDYWLSLAKYFFPHKLLIKNC